MTPLVSVCIPAYNPGPYLELAVESVLAQDLEEFELFVVDDASQPPVSGSLPCFRDQRTRLLRNSSNLGLARNWNRCLELSQGEFVTIFHQDDVMLPGNLRAKARVLQENPSVGMVYSDIMRINEAGVHIGGHWVPQPGADLVGSGGLLYQMVAATGNPVSCPSVMVRAEAYRRLGDFDTSLGYAVDLEMWLRVAAEYDIAFIASPLVAQRVHAGQETARYAGTGKDYLEVLRALDLAYHRRLPAALLHTRRQAYWTLASQCLPMLRWKLRQGKLVPAWRYGLAATSALLRSIVPSGG